MLLNGMIDHLGFILRTHARQELLLGFGDAQFVEGVLDVIGHIIPRLFTTLSRLDIVKDVFQIQARKVRSPGRHGTTPKVLVRLQSEVKHPLRLALHSRNLLHYFTAQASLGLENVTFFRIVEPVFILSNIFEQFLVTHNYSLESRE